MRTLHLFGDSFTEGHILDTTFPPFKEWKKYRGGELPLIGLTPIDFDGHHGQIILKNINGLD